MTDPLLRLESCVVGYPGLRVAGPLDLSVHPGDLLIVAGPNGCGKSTVLRTVLGSLKPLSGRVARQPGLRLGYVPQRGVLDVGYPLTLKEMVRMGFHVSPWGDARAESLDRMDKVLEELDLKGLAGRLYRELSGGEKQRALLARALVSEPGLLLLDEPAEGLDLGAERELDRILQRLRREGRVAVVQVSHLIHPVEREARVLFIREGEGRIGPAPEILTPALLSGAYGRPVQVDSLEDGRLRVMEAAP